jgi:hypothetical protein
MTDHPVHLGFSAENEFVVRQNAVIQPRPAGARQEKYSFFLRLDEIRGTGRGSQSLLWGLPVMCM